MPAHLAVANAPVRAASGTSPRSSASAASQRPEYLSIDELCGDDAHMQMLVERGKRFIDRGLPVLILGETGTGKEYLARALHAYSERRAQSMVAINTASIPEHLVESELFGYCRGAFSGALPGGMKGKLQEADGGTLFLDEIGDMPLALQTRLLRVLSEREVTPLGASRAVPVDVQLICATHQNLSTLVAQGKFREDLYYRIAVGVLSLPALRERDDRRALIGRMLRDEWPMLSNAEALRRVAAPALACLEAFAWPGNLRQLRATLRFACAVMSGNALEMHDLPPEIQRDAHATRDMGDRPRASDAQRMLETRGQRDALTTSRDMAFAQTRQDVAALASRDDRTTGVASLSGSIVRVPVGRVPFAGRDAAPVHIDDTPHDDDAQQPERDRIVQALAQHRWNISAAARSLGFCRASLYRKLKQLHIPHVRDCANELAGACHA